MPLVKTILARADRSHVLAVLGTLGGKPGNVWLTAAPPLSTGQLPKGWANVSALPAQELINVLGATVPNHCSDAWTYLSRSLSAIVAGDAHSCRHLAYYAQLRSALSILANLGVGVFNKINFVVDRNGRVHRLDPIASGGNSGGLGTHAIVWEALEAWSDDGMQSRVFLDLIKIKGVSLRDLMQIIWPGIAIPSVARQIIEGWGLDLRRGQGDRSERNVSSYVPRSLNPISPAPLEIMEFIAETWRLLEPTSGSSFDGLDRFLLRSVFQKYHQQITGDTDYAAGPIAARYSLMPAAIRGLVSVDFLLGTNGENDPQVITKALATTAPALPLEMLARAFILVRAASAFTHSSLLDAGLNLAQGDLRPWLDQWAEERGFWHPTGKLTDPTELWDDVNIALLDLEDSILQSPAHISEWHQRTYNGLPKITEAERAGVWSFT